MLNLFYYYTLQCPNHREHCGRKNNITDYQASDYETIPIKRCSVCDAVLVYIETNSGSFELVCPNDILHQQPLKTTLNEIMRLGYSSGC